MRHYLLTILLIGCMHLLAACAATPSRSIAWPVESYADVCRYPIIPPEPSCLITIGDGFKYDGEFQACRTSLSNYLSGLDRFRDCASDELIALFNNLMGDARKTYNCYVDMFDPKAPATLSIACPGIETARFRKDNAAEGLEYDLGVPRCVRKDGGFDVPKIKYQIEMCRDAIEAFQDRSSFSFGYGKKSAQRQHDDYMASLKQKILYAADDAVRKFNCLARNERFCV